MQNQGKRVKVNTQLPTAADQIEYMADLIVELSQMARENNFGMLAAILELAHSEARRQAKDST